MSVLYDHDIAVNIAKAVIAANWRLAELTGLTTDELQQELAEEIWRAHMDFDPAKAQYVTFASDVAWKRLMDRQRSGSRRLVRDAKFAALAAESVTAVMKDGEIENPLTGGVPEIEIKIPQKLSPYVRGRIGHSPTAYAQALAYRHLRGMGWRTLHRMLQKDAALRRTLGFLGAAPPLSCLQDAAVRLRKWAGRMAREV